MDVDLYRGSVKHLGLAFNRYRLCFLRIAVSRLCSNFYEIWYCSLALPHRSRRSMKRSAKGALGRATCQSSGSCSRWLLEQFADREEMEVA